MTELLTAAIAETAKIALRLPSIPKKGTLYNKAPVQAPISRAGEKTPPKRPNPIQSEDKKILETKINNKKIIVLFSVITFIIVSDPNPIAPGIKIPNPPHIRAGIKGLYLKSILDELEIFVLNNNDFIKR